MRVADIMQTGAEAEMHSFESIECVQFDHDMQWNLLPTYYMYSGIAKYISQFQNTTFQRN